ncbi:MAG: FkbM family methyltransferase [Magnetococcales bacterium]|nr:FkbM family methyltransferase [Magnetococcales bacterium]
MTIKKQLNKFRFNKVISSVLVFFLTPIYSICRILHTQIAMKIWANGHTVVYDGIQLKFPTNVGVHYCSNIYWNGVAGFEPHEWSVMKPLLLQARSFIDVGSNIGFYSVMASKINPALQIVGFEPIPSIHSENQEFHHCNGLSGDCIKMMGLGDFDGTTTAHLPDAPDEVEQGTCGTLRQDSWQARRQNKQVFDVTVRRLDTFLAEHEMSTPMFIKIDVEDFEHSVLLGAEQTLLVKRPIILIELLSREHGNAETYKYFMSMKYRLFAITGQGCFQILRKDLSKKRKWMNCLAVPSENLGADTAFLTLTDLFVSKSSES